jgi:hypothetical protein
MIPILLCIAVALSLPMLQINPHLTIPTAIGIAAVLLVVWHKLVRPIL